jgi:hypothetical protein
MQRDSFGGKDIDGNLHVSRKIFVVQRIVTRDLEGYSIELNKEESIATTVSRIEVKPQIRRMVVKPMLSGNDSQSQAKNGGHIINGKGQSKGTT